MFLYCQAHGRSAFLFPLRLERVNSESNPNASQDINPKPLPIPDEDAAVIWVAPRGIGPTAWNQSSKKQVQIRRRFYLLGQTLDGMRVYDVRRAIQAIRLIPEFNESELRIRARGPMAGISLYASLFEPEIAGLHLTDLESSHRHGPYLLNVRRIFDLPQALAMAAERTPIVLESANSKDWSYATEIGRRIGGEIEFRP
ncbi:hypothetical protein ACFL2H_04105 [Planctomycetota bacterium]